MAEEIPVDCNLIGVLKNIPPNPLLAANTIPDSQLILRKHDGNQVSYFLHEGYKSSQSHKLSTFISSRLQIEGFLAYLNDIGRLRQEFETLKNEIQTLLEYAKSTIEKDIEYYQTEERLKSEYLNQLFREENTDEFKQYLVKLGVGLIKTIFAKYQKLGMLRQTKEYERERAQKLYEAKKFVEGGREILNILYAKKELIDGGYFERIITDYERISCVFGEIDTFTNEVMSRGNYLETGNDFQVGEIQHFIGLLQNFYQKFQDLFNKMAYLKADIELNDRKIGFLLRFWDNIINIERELAARKFILTEMKYLLAKIERCKLVSLIFENYTKTMNLTRCFELLQKSVNSCQQSLASARLEGSLIIGQETCTGRYSCMHSYSYQKATVSHNFNIVKDLAVALTSDPYYYVAHSKTLHADHLRDFLGAEYNKAVIEYQKYDAYVAEQQQLSKEQELIHKARADYLENLSRYLIKAQNSHYSLVTLLEKRNFSFNRTILPCWFGVLLHSSTVKPNSSTTEFDKYDFSAVNLDPKYVYSILFAILFQKGKVNKTKCVMTSSDEIVEIHSCELIEFDDLRELVFSPRIYGCLKNRLGQSQTFENYMRSEDVSDSLFNIFSKTIELIVLDNLRICEVNEKDTLQKTEMYKEAYFDILETYGHKSLKDKVKKLAKKAEEELEKQRKKKEKLDLEEIKKKKKLDLEESKKNKN